MKLLYDMLLTNLIIPNTRYVNIKPLLPRCDVIFLDFYVVMAHAVPCKRHIRTSDPCEVPLFKDMRKYM
jgi:hypothetical protein